jgi:repressor LexA
MRKSSGNNLTSKQTVVLDFLKKFIAEHGYPPAVREICTGLKLSSPATVHTHLKELEKKGYINKQDGKFRTIEINGDNEYLEPTEEVVMVPLLGRVACGDPIEAIENPEDTFSLPASLIPENKAIFTLQCNGDSMINAGIYDKDIVIIAQQPTCNNGDIVVAMTEDNDVTLKRFYKEADHIRLQPENDALDPIILSNCTVLGKAIGLYRKI